VTVQPNQRPSPLRLGSPREQVVVEGGDRYNRVGENRAVVEFWVV
jgi:hypothetical protein